MRPNVAILVVAVLTQPRPTLARAPHQMLGFDARFVRGGVAAWYASGGARALKPTAG